jgi:hypothetical protein
MCLAKCKKEESNLCAYTYISEIWGSHGGEYEDDCLHIFVHLQWIKSNPNDVGLNQIAKKSLENISNKPNCYLTDLLSNY